MVRQNPMDKWSAVPGDCPDCGRVTIYRNLCGKCGGKSWLPMGYFDRQHLRDITRPTSTSDAPTWNKVLDTHSS